VEITSDANTRGFAKTEQATAGLGSKLKKGLGGGLAVLARVGPLAAAAGAAMAVGFAGQSLSAAGDVQQAFGALDSVFKGNAATVKDWATGAVDSVGLAKGEYATLAASLGASLKNSGIEDFTGQTDVLIRKGADLAATFGGTTADAVAALGSLLRGETDPIEQYGVSIRQSDVNARLAALGQDQLTGAALKTAEQQARLDLVMQQTTDSTGQFARESGTLAGQQQRLGARFENLKATLGEKLIPIVTSVLGWFNNLLSGTGRVSGAVDRLRAVFTTIGGVISAYLSPIIAGIRAAFDRVSATIRDVTSKSDNLKVGISVLGTILRTAASVVGTILGTAFRILGGAISAVIRIVDGLIGAVRAAIRWLGDLASKIADSPIGQAVGFIGDLFGGGPPRRGGRRPPPGAMLAGGFGASQFAHPAVLRSATTVRVGFNERRLRDLITVTAETVVRREAARLARGVRYP
jgi:hypothetical protein